MLARLPRMNTPVAMKLLLETAPRCLAVRLGRRDRGVRVLGTRVKTIRDTEDRKLFIERLADHCAQPRLPHGRRGALGGPPDWLPGDAACGFRAGRPGQRHRGD
jgi:hypothetical protein